MLNHFGKFLLLVISLLVMACGAITVEIDTKVEDETDIVHDIRLVASGQIATLMSGEWNEDDLPDNCSASVEIEAFEVECSGLSQANLSGESLTLEDSDFDVQVVKEDKGDYWQYRATTENIFYETDNELKDNPLAEGMDIDAILKARFHWTVEMPGEILDSNSDSVEGNRVFFTTSPTDSRRELFVVSQEKKPSGFFGACN